MLFVMATVQEYGPALRSKMQPLICGVGPVEAAIATTAYLQASVAAGVLPELVVSIGSAGSKRREWGSVYQISSVTFLDMDASKLGFAKGVTPFVDRPATIRLATPLVDVPRATLSTGAKVLGDGDYAHLETDLVDMETFAVLRACERFGVAMIGLRGVSDGPGDVDSADGWARRLGEVDRRLASAVDELFAVGPALAASVGAVTHEDP